MTAREQPQTQSLGLAREGHDPTGGDGFVRDAWRHVENALLAGLITDEEYAIIAERKNQ